MHTTHLILSSYHLLVQVPSYATPPREKARDWGSGRWGNCNGGLPLLFSLNSHSPKGGMERVNVRGAVTEMSLYPNCNSVRNTNLQTSDEQWPLEGENKRLTRAVEGLTLKGARAVQDKASGCLWTVCHGAPFPGYRESFHLQGAQGAAVSLAFHLEANIPALEQVLYTHAAGDSKGLPIFTLR